MKNTLKKLTSATLCVTVSLCSLMSTSMNSAAEEGRFSGMTLAGIIDTVGDNAFYQTYSIWHGTACYLVDGSDYKGYFIEETAKATYVTITDGTSLPVAEINSKLSNGGQSDTLLYEQDGVYWYGSNGEVDHEKAVSVLSEYDNVLSIDTKCIVSVKDSSTRGSYVNIDYLYVDSEIDAEGFIADYPELQLSVPEYSPSEPAVTHLYTFSIGAKIGLINTEDVYNGLKRLMGSGIEYYLDWMVSDNIAPSSEAYKNIYTKSDDTPTTSCPDDLTQTTTSAVTEITTTTTADTKYFASIDEMVEMAKKDYQSKTGAYPASAEGILLEDGSLSIAMYDDSGALLETYVIDPVTGNGNAQGGDDVSLPQTGNNSLTIWLIYMGAFAMIGFGAFTVKHSGVVRRKKEER